MKIHIIQHEFFEAPAAILDWAIKKGHEVSFTKVYLKESLPETVGDLDFLVIMGGPQSPSTTEAECPYFKAEAEIEFIKKAIAADKLLLGVCLGAQLIGEALGASYDHSPNREIGVFDLTLTADAAADPVFSKFPQVFPVGHWHGDMPGLTPDAQILATSAGCPRQVVKYSPRIYGFQCHFEFTQEAIAGMIENCSAELAKYSGLPFVEDAEKLRAHDFSGINAKLFAFLDYFELL